MPAILQHQATDHPVEIWKPAWLVKAAIRWLDTAISRRLGIFAFCHDRECILRIALVRSRGHARLSDGSEVKPGEPIIELHLWNERLPRLERNGNTLEWAQHISLSMDLSLERLAEYFATHLASAHCKAIHGRFAFSLRQGLRQLDRLGSHYGFDVFDDDRPQTLGQRLHDTGENVLLWMILWAYNPGSIKYSRFRRRRREVWMSVETLSLRYGARHRKRWVLVSKDPGASQYKTAGSA